MINQVLLSTLMLAPVLSRAEVVQFDKGNVRAEVGFTKGPFSAARKESVMQLQLLERAGARKVDLKSAPVVEFDMKMNGAPSHGPGGVVQIAKGPSDNVFDASQIYFTMAGEWTAKITLKFQDGSTETQSLKISVP